MKFRCERDVLASAVSASGRAASSKGLGARSAAGIKIMAKDGRVEFLGAGDAFSVETWREAGVITEGEVIAPARLLNDIVKALPQGTVTLELQETDLHASSGRAHFTLRRLEEEGFPRVDFPVEYTTKLPGQSFVNALSKVVDSASTDPTRQILTGVYVSAEDEGLRLVATDSYRLAVSDIPEAKLLQVGQSVSIPSNALGELQKLLGDSEELEVYLDEQEVAFRFGNTRMSTRLIAGQFPNYRSLLPSSYPNRLTVQKSQILEALHRVKLLVREATTPVRLQLESDHVEISVNSHEVGRATEDVDAQYDGEPMTVAFNPQYLIQGIEVLDGEEVVLKTLDALKAATLQSSENPDFLYLIMPVRVS